MKKNHVLHPQEAVLVHIKSRIGEGPDQEEMEQTCQGTVTKIGKRFVLAYEEDMGVQEKTMTRLWITSEEVRLVRRGPVRTTFVFRSQESTLCRYRTEDISLEFMLWTQDIILIIKKQGLVGLRLFYRLSQKNDLGTVYQMEIDLKRMRNNGIIGECQDEAIEGESR